MDFQVNFIKEGKSINLFVENYNNPMIAFPKIQNIENPSWINNSVPSLSWNCWSLREYCWWLWQREWLYSHGLDIAVLISKICKACWDFGFRWIQSLTSFFSRSCEFRVSNQVLNYSDIKREDAFTFATNFFISSDFSFRVNLEFRMMLIISCFWQSFTNSCMQLSSSLANASA